MKLDRNIVITILILVYSILIMSARIGPLNTTIDLQRSDDFATEYISAPSLKINNVGYNFASEKTIRPGEKMFEIDPSNIWQNKDNHLEFELFNRMPISSNIEVRIAFKTDKCFQPMATVSREWNFGQDSNTVKFGGWIDSYSRETIRIKFKCTRLLLESVNLIWAPIL